MTLMAIVFSLGRFSLLLEAPTDPLVLFDRGGFEEGGLKLFCDWLWSKKFESVLALGLTSSSSEKFRSLGFFSYFLTSGIYGIYSFLLSYPEALES